MKTLFTRAEALEASGLTESQLKKMILREKIILKHRKAPRLGGYQFTFEDIALLVIYKRLSKKNVYPVVEKFRHLVFNSQDVTFLSRLSKKNLRNKVYVVKMDDIVHELNRKLLKNETPLIGKVIQL